MQQQIFTLVGKREIARSVFELHLAGDAGAIDRPGQFVNIKVEGQFLRRPISVCDRTPDGIVLICRAQGEGTRRLCAAAPGTPFDLLVGLGNGYDLDACAGHNPVLVGGGVGVPPLYWLAKELVKRGARPVAALGFNTAADVFYAREFAALGCDLLLSTMDGSQGDKGVVTETIAARAPQCDYAYCCGPEPMLKAVWSMPQTLDGQFSFEERMGCGFGACMGCTCKTKYGDKRICKDGPVLRKEEIIW